MNIGISIDGQKRDIDYSPNSTGPLVWEFVVSQDSDKPSTHTIVATDSSGAYKPASQTQTINITSWKQNSEPSITAYPTSAVSFTFQKDPNAVTRPITDVEPGSDSDPNKVHSGGKFSVTCPTADQVNSDALSSYNTYGLSTNWSAMFDNSTDTDEYINSTHFVIANTADRTIKEDRDLGLSQYTNKSGSLSFSLDADKKFTYALSFEIYRGAGIKKDKFVGWITSNACEVYRDSKDPTKTVAKTGGDAGANREIDTSTPENSCGCGTIKIISWFTNPFCEITCTLIYALIEAMRDTIGGWLNDAVQT